MTTHSEADKVETPGADSAQARQRISTQQTLHLMRLEADRALRHDYPITCLVLGLDTPEGDDGPMFGRIVAPQLFQVLKTVTFENDLRGLGIFVEQMVLAVFPHVDPEKLQAVADQLLSRAQELEVPELPDGYRLTASAGISHNLHPDEMSFETLVEEAETGMRLGHGSGGNRVTLARDVERELDKLRAEVEMQIEELDQYQQELFGNQSEDVWGKQLVDKVIELFRREPHQSEGLLRVEKEVIALLRFEIAEWKESSSAEGLMEAKQTIGMLERRVQKLTQGLDLTENELKRVAQMKNIDLGVASIYRNVQGLSSDDDNHEQKKEMLKDLFEANVAFRNEAASK